MNWIELTPFHPALAPVVERYMLRRMTPLRCTVSDRILPRSGTSLFLDLGPSASERSLLKGPHESFYCLPLRAGVEIDQMIVEFTPWGLSRLTNTPLRHIVSQLIPASELIGSESEWTELIEALRPLSLERRLGRMDEFLVSKLRETADGQGVIEDLAFEMRREARLHTREEVESRTLRSLRQVERRFLDVTGMSRRSLHSLFRFEGTRKLLAAGEGSLTRIAQDAGFYDQSQFNREIRRRTGLPPSELMGDLPPCHDC